MIVCKIWGTQLVHAWRMDNGFTADFMCGDSRAPLTTFNNRGAVLVDEGPASSVNCANCKQSIRLRIEMRDQIREGTLLDPKGGDTHEV